MESVHQVPALSSKRQLEVPDEILSHILGMHFNSTEDVAKPSSLGRLAPLLVSRRWNNVAISSPNCWTKFVVSTSLVYRSSTSQRLSRQFHLARNLPVDLVFNVTRSSGYGQKFPLDYEVSDVVLQNSSKIRSYAEMGLGDGSHSMLIRFLQNPSPILTHLFLGDLDLDSGPLHHGGRPSFTVLQHLHVQTLPKIQLWKLSSCCPALITLVCEDYYVPDPGYEWEEEEEERREEVPVEADREDFLPFSLSKFPRLKEVTLPQMAVETIYDPACRPEEVGVKTVTLHEMVEPLHHNEKRNNLYMNPSIFAGFLQTFPNIEHLVLSNTILLFSLIHSYHWPTSIHNIRRVTFEGIIRSQPVCAILKTLPNLRHVCFELYRPSFVRGSRVREVLGPSAIFELDSPHRKGPIGQAQAQLIEDVAEVLMETGGETSPAPTFTHCTHLEHLEFSGFGITEADSQHLMKLIKLRDKCIDSSSSDQRVILTLRKCFLSGGPYDTCGEGSGEGGDAELEHEEGRAEEEESQKEVTTAYRRLRRFIPDTEHIGYLDAKRLFETVNEDHQ